MFVNVSRILQVSLEVINTNSVTNVKQILAAACEDKHFTFHCQFGDTRTDNNNNMLYFPHFVTLQTFYYLNTKKEGDWLPEITIELKRAGSQFSKSDHTNLGRYTNTDKHTYT